MDYFRSIVVVRALLDNQDGEARVGFCKTTSDYTAGETTCGENVSQ